MFWRKSLAERIRELDERVTNLKRQVEQRDLDWVDMRSRCRRLLDRTEKAADRLTSQDQPEVESTASQPQNGEDVVSAGRVLSPRQMQVQQSILKRRAGL